MGCKNISSRYISLSGGKVRMKWHGSLKYSCFQFLLSPYEIPDDSGYFERTKDIKFTLERKKNRILVINRGTNMMNINNICSP